MLLQSQSTSQHQVITAHLAQTMSLLELTSEELGQKIEAALASNPALELMDEKRCPQCQRRLTGSQPCQACSSPQRFEGNEPIIFISPRWDFYHPSQNASDLESLSDEWAAESEDLSSYVLRQIAPELPVEDRPLAAHMLTSLDEDGLLTIPLVEVARYHHVLLARVESVQRLIQHADPPGVGSSTPQAALLVQLEMLGETKAVPTLAARAIQEGMDFLSRRAYNELGRLLHISTKEAIRIANFISENLNPYPARAHWGDMHHGREPTRGYQNADVIITRLYDTGDTPLVVEIVSPYAGSLRINPLFKESISQAPTEKAEQWQSSMEDAVLLIKCLQQRDHTLVRLMQRLVVLQRMFILEGDACLIPITRAQLSVELDVHESTVSRAVSGKAVQLPNKRIIPLSKLFDRSLHVRTAIIEIIAQEKKPLSDTQIAELLIQQGHEVARRTVAKYRSMEGILPARLRQVNATAI
jgi:RNA polymerase sigma-54 factor